MPTPKVTVLMSVYNGKKYLQEAIESILHQTFTDFEFLIIDDASTDTTPKILQQYCDPRIRIVKNEKNLGLTKSLNKGLTLAKGEYIARMDADDISTPERFEKQLNYFEQNPETIVLGTGFLIIDYNGEIVGRKLFSEKPTIDDFFRENQIIHGSVMFKKSVIINLGGYNEYFRYVQDYELWLKVSKKYQMRNLPEILYKLRYHGDNIAYTKKEESTLFHILAIKLARGEIDFKQISPLNNNNIRNLFGSLNRKELITFYNSMAGLYLFKGDMASARKEYKKILILNPFDMVNIIRIARTFFGNEIIVKTSQIYDKFINFVRKFKN
jgi:glycosyltransferase involved in cell wall biosynthesis